MKNFVLAIITTLLLTGCKRSTPLSEIHRWERTSVEQADSLTLQLAHAYARSFPVSEKSELTDSLSRLARHTADPRVKARASYWRARMAWNIGRQEYARDEITGAMRRLDSARYRHDYYMLRSQLERMSPEVKTRYRLATENLAYFRSTGDSLSVAHCLTTLGNLFLSIDKFEQARGCFGQASAIWNDKGLTPLYTKSLINIAICSPRDKADSIYRKLMDSEIIQADTIAYELVLRNLGMKNSAMIGHCSREALNLTKNRPEMHNIAAVDHAMVAQSLLPDDPDSSLQHAMTAVSLYDPVRLRQHEPELAIYVERTAADAWMAVGRPDSAVPHLRASYEILHENVSDHSVNITVEMGRLAVAEANFAASLRAERQGRIFWTVLFVIAVISASVGLFLTRRLHDSRMKESLAKANQTQAQARLARESVLFEQKEHLLGRLRKTIEEHRDSGDISPNAAGSMLSALKVYDAGRDERQTFLEIHDHMLPGFASRLKADFPTISENQIKLAAYISAGMSNASIAKLLNISAASVRTSRYRLRSKFGLNTEDSLEEFLRRYVGR